MNKDIGDLIIATLDSNGERCSYYSLILSKCKKIASKSCPTMGVCFSKDGQLVLLYNPDFVDKLTIPEAIATLKHEAMHIFLKHMSRFSENTNHKLANIACDMAINQYLKCLPEGVVYPESFGLPKGGYAEAYYDALEEQQKQQQQQGQPKSGSGGGNGNSSQSQNDSQDNGEDSQDSGGDDSQDSQQGNKKSKKKSGKDKGDQQDDKRGENADDHDCWKDVVDMDGNKVGDVESCGIDDEATIEKVVKQVAQEMMDDEHGNVPDWAKKTLEDMKAQKSKVNWKREFRLLVQSVLTINRRRSQKRVDRKLACVCSDWVFAGKKKDNMPRVLMVRDTSGSIFYDNESIQGMLNELAEISKRASTWVCDCDTQIKQVYQVKKATDFKPLKGGGGTDFCEPFYYAIKNHFDAVIYMTDLCGDFPDKDKVGKLARNTIWVVFDEHYKNMKVPFGKVLYIPQDQMK